MHITKTLKLAILLFLVPVNKSHKVVHNISTFFFTDLDMAIAYWNIVLKGRFKFLELWCKFLQVSLVQSVN